MSGMPHDVLSILKHNSMAHRESLGYIYSTKTDGDSQSLLLHLAHYGLKVTGIKERGVLWDYIFIPKLSLSTRNILKALSSTSSGGIVILQLDDRHSQYQDRYLRLGIGASATKVNYDDRYYLVIHPGDDYGN